MDTITRALFGFCLLILSGSVAATAITGTINIGGSSTVVHNGTTATGVNFNGGFVNMFPAPTGAFAGLGNLTTGNGLTLSNIVIPSQTQQPIWSINHNGLLYSFTLSSIQILGGNSGNFSTLALGGTGIINITGGNTSYTATPGSWIYTKSGASFSSQSVPEPGTIALFGLGLIGIGAISRIRKTT